MEIQPALDVWFYFLEGDVLLLGTTGAVQIELKDRTGELYCPQGDIVVSVYPVDDANTIADSPCAAGVARQETLEDMTPLCGRYYFEFDTGSIPAASPRVLIRANIPYNGKNVLWQRTIQLQDPNELS